jgi:uncharacterized membrane protein YphA (DoxX/SURF4 family)
VHHSKMTGWAILYLRWSLGLTFLSACADRFGLWGPPGSRYAVWGDWSHFAAYAATMNSFLPAWLHTPAAYIATIAETSFGIALIAGLFLRAVAFGSAFLLGLFALAMTISLGIKAPLNYSVFVDAGAAWLLACMVDQRYGLAAKGGDTAHSSQKT